jgi:hypothetical protein
VASQIGGSGSLELLCDMNCIVGPSSVETRFEQPSCSDGNTVLLFGGGIATSSPIVPFGGTWQWDGQHWTERQNMGPPARMAAGLAFDSTRNRYVLFGGAGTPPSGATDFPFLGDTWETFDPAAPSP